MKRILLFFPLLTLALIPGRAQEYRIQQKLPELITEVEICSGWEVRILRQPGQSNSITIVTPCEAFYTDANEPEVCWVDKCDDGGMGSKLVLKANTTMPKSTILEINLGDVLQCLTLRPSAHLTTGNLLFAPGANIMLERGATVTAGTWRCVSGCADHEAVVSIYSSASLQIDTLQVGRGVVKVLKNATLQYAHLEADSLLQVRCDRHSFGTPVVTDSSLHVSTRRLPGIYTYMMDGNKGMLTFGFTISPSTHYRYGMAYNTIGTLTGSVLVGLKPFDLSSRWRLFHSLQLDIGLSQMSQDVKASEGRLVFSSDLQGQTSHQWLSNFTLGVPLRLAFNPFKNDDDFGIFVGIMPSFSCPSKLITRVLNSNDHFDVSTDKLAVLRTFQLRATIGLCDFSSFFGYTSLHFFVDLLPTYRSGIGADGLHQMGFNFSF